MARDPFSDVDIANLLNPKGRLRVPRATYTHIAREVGRHDSYTTRVFMLLRRIGIPIALLSIAVALLISGIFTDFSLPLALLWAIPLLIIGYWLVRTTISDIVDLVRHADQVLDPGRNNDGTFDPFNPPKPRRDATGGEWERYTVHQNLGPDGGPRFRRGIALPRDEQPAETDSTAHPNLIIQADTTPPVRPAIQDQTNPETPTGKPKIR